VAAPLRTNQHPSPALPYKHAPRRPVDADYISFIRAATPNHSQEYMQQLKRFNMGAPGESDCPVFDGMYEYFAVRRGRGSRAAFLGGTRLVMCVWGRRKAAGLRHVRLGCEATGAAARVVPLSGGRWW
jgi:hypothetical protein